MCWNTHSLLPKFSLVTFHWCLWPLDPYTQAPSTGIQASVAETRPRGKEKNTNSSVFPPGKTWVRRYFSKEANAWWLAKYSQHATLDGPLSLLDSSFGFKPHNGVLGCQPWLSCAVPQSIWDPAKRPGIVYS